MMVYVAGPFRAPTPYAVEENVRRAEAWILPLARAGFVPIVPHCLFRHFDKAMPDAFWLDATLELMGACDAVVRLPGASAGADAELAVANAAGMPIVVALGPATDSGAVKAVIAMLRASLAELDLSSEAGA